MPKSSLELRSSLFGDARVGSKALAVERNSGLRRLADRLGPGVAEANMPGLLGARLGTFLSRRIKAEMTLIAPCPLSFAAQRQNRRWLNCGVRQNEPMLRNRG